VLAAAAMGLFVAIGLGERRHEFATMAALGSSLREIGAFLWTEAALVLGAGLALAAGLGWLLSKIARRDACNTSSTRRPTRWPSPGRSSPSSPGAPQPRDFSPASLPSPESGG